MLELAVSSNHSSVDPELADFIRKGGRIALPEKYHKAVTVLLDDEVVAHFRVGEEGWMERVNAALRKAGGPRIDKVSNHDLT